MNGGNLEATDAIDLYRRYAHFRQIASYLPLAIRKDIMTMLRVGGTFQDNRRLRNALYKTWVSKGFRHTVRCRQWGGDTVVDHNTIYSFILPFLATPTRRAYLSAVLRNSPDRSGTWVEALEDGKKKELSVSQKILAKTYHLQFPFFESRDACLSIPIHPLIPHRPYLALFMRKRFLQYRQGLAHILLVPQCSTSKTIGIHSSRNLHSVSGMSYSPMGPYTTADLERHYMETGQLVDGPSEVRVAWKYNDLKPRLYYAIGASAYYAARYTWAITDRLTRIFKATDPRHRFSFYRFPMIKLPPDCFLVYDYATFTTNLSEFHNFFGELAGFLKGVPCHRFDTYTGVVEDDIGSILESYNDICNLRPSFSVHRVIEGIDPDHPLAIIRHEVAGLLGVYGNITGSTALHGFLGIMIAGSEDLVNAIGDDGGIQFNIQEQSLSDVIEAIRILGDIADEKYQVWVRDSHDSASLYDESWHFVKRPIDVVATAIKQEWMPDFPIMSRIEGQTDDMHTVPLDNPTVRRRLLIKQTCRLMDSMHIHLSEVTQSDIDLTLVILRKLYKKVLLPSTGSLPRSQEEYPFVMSGAPRGDNIFAVPILCEESIRNGWWATLRENASPEGTIRVPILGLTPTELPSVLQPGIVFLARGDRVLSLLVKMNILRQYAPFEELLVTPYSLDLFDFYMNSKSASVYEYTCINEYQAWESYISYDKAKMLYYPFLALA